MRLSRPISTWVTASIHSRGVSPRLMPRSKRSMLAGISSNNGSSASLRSSSRASSASCRSTTVPTRSAWSPRALRNASRNRCGGSSGLVSSMVLRWRQPHMGRTYQPVRTRQGAASIRLGMNPNESRSMPARDNPVRPRPGEAVLGSRPRPVLATDPSAVTQAIEHREDCRVAHLPVVGLAARGDARDLHMPDNGEIFLKPPNQIAAHDLGMIEVELHAHIRPPDLVDDVGRLLDATQKVVRP